MRKKAIETISQNITAFHLCPFELDFTTFPFQQRNRDYILQADKNTKAEHDSSKWQKHHQ